MKTNVIDVLIYVFEHYVDDEIELNADFEALSAELKKNGFAPELITDAFAWLEDLAHSRDVEIKNIDEKCGSTRHYLAAEHCKLDTECRGLLYRLEQLRVLDATNREFVIERVMALPHDDIDVDQLKWVILMVLFNQPGQEQAYRWLEGLLADGGLGRVH